MLNLSIKSDYTSHNVDPFAIELKHRGFTEREIYAIIGNYVKP